MVHRSFSIAVALASILASSSADFNGLRIPNHEASMEEEDIDSWIMKGGDVVEKGGKCTSKMDKKKGFSRNCEGGYKEVKSIGIGAKELAEDVSAKVRDMHSDMILSDHVLVPKETLMELLELDKEFLSGDAIDDEDFFPEDCSEDGCGKTMKFGGITKIFWGCNVTYARKGMKVSKVVKCGAKSTEGAGSYDGMEYFDIDEEMF